MEPGFATAMAGAASAHQAASATHEETSQQRAGSRRRSSADPQRAQQGATAAADAAPAALDRLSRLQHLADASPQVAQLRRLQALADGRSAPVAQLAGGPEEEEELLQGKFASDQIQPQLQQAPRANNTGLPDQLKRGIESLSGLSMDHVRVHYNSAHPAQLNALAYAQGSDIHLAPGQEQHLPHEAWHVVQQAQGRVQPTMQMAGGVAVNDDAGLEREADVMGGKALESDASNRAIEQQLQKANLTAVTPISSSPTTVQGVFNYANGRQMSMVTRGQIIPIWQHKNKFGEFLKFSNNSSPLTPMNFETYLAGSGLSQEDIEAINALIGPDMAREEEALDHEEVEAEHSTGAKDLILNWEDMQWIEKSQLAFRFHASAASLSKEVSRKRMDGHKHPMYYMKDIFKAVGVDAENLAAVPSGKREDVIREYQRRLLLLSQASLVHVDSGQFFSAGFIIAKLEKDDRALLLEELLGKGQSNLIDGLGGTPFGAYLGDSMSEGLDDGKFIVKEIDVLINSTEAYLRHKWSLSDMVIQYIKSQGQVRASELNGKVPQSVSIADPQSQDYVDPKNATAKEKSGPLDIPDLRELTEEEILAQELRETEQRAEAIKEIEKSMVEINRLATIQAKLLGGGELDSGDFEFLKEQRAKRGR